MPAGIDTLASELQSRLDQMAPDDSRRLFCSVYRRTTLAVGEEIVRGGKEHFLRAIPLGVAVNSHYVRTIAQFIWD